MTKPDRPCDTVFHEVRVPLNTALLSVQNLEGEKLFDGFTSDQKELVYGLTGSLSMMEKVSRAILGCDGPYSFHCVFQVLNDVLSFNRMETGTFTQAKAPFDIHQSVQLTSTSHASLARMKGIKLETELDPNIDKLDSLFVGDEMRLRQITRWDIPGGNACWMLTRTQQSRFKLSKVYTRGKRQDCHTSVVPEDHRR